MKNWRTLWLSGCRCSLPKLAGALGPSPAGAVNFQVSNLSNNSYRDYSPHIDGGRVVWYGYGGPEGSSEISLASSLIFYDFTCYYDSGAVDYYSGYLYDLDPYEAGDKIPPVWRA